MQLTNVIKNNKKLSRKYFNRRRKPKKSGCLLKETGNLPRIVTWKAEILNAFFFHIIISLNIN